MKIFPIKFKRLPYIFILLLVYVLIAAILYLLNIHIHFVGATRDWIDFSIYLQGIVAPITALATIYVTYLVYKLSVKTNRAEHYFERIVDLYYSIMEEGNSLMRCRKNKHLKEKIEQDVILLRYYLSNDQKITWYDLHPLRGPVNTL